MDAHLLLVGLESRVQRHFIELAESLQYPQGVGFLRAVALGLYLLDDRQQRLHLLLAAALDELVGGEQTDREIRMGERLDQRLAVGLREVRHRLRGALAVLAAPDDAPDAALIAVAAGVLQVHL